MSKRLQVLIEAKEYQQFQQLAQLMGLTLGEWARRALRQSAADVSPKSPEDKLAAIRRASKYSFPTCDIDQMLREIEQGYLEP